MVTALDFLVRLYPEKSTVQAVSPQRGAIRNCIPIE